MGQARIEPPELANERLTALAGAVLLPLIVIVIASAANAHVLLPIHIFVGVLFIGPLAVMIGSSGYRFLRYYTKSPAYVRRAKPPVRLRVLAPMLLMTTVLVVGTGLALLVAGPRFLVLHVFSALAWLPAVTIHAVAHLPRIARVLADDWRRHLGIPASGRERRFGVVLGSVVIGLVAAVAVQPLAVPFIDWSSTIGYGPGPFLVGLAIATVAAVITRPIRWTESR